MVAERVILEPDNYPSVQQEPLAGLELEALAYWRRFLPTLSSQLESRGPNALPTAIRKAWWRREYGIRLAQARNPDLPREIAAEMLHEELFPPPEPQASDVLLDQPCQRHGSRLPHTCEPSPSYGPSASPPSPSRPTDGDLAD